MRTVFIITILAFVNSIYAQNITFDQAQNLRKKSLAEVEIFLTEKGWSMTEADEAKENKMGSATFGYNVDQFDSEKAASWIVLHESGISNTYNILSIQVNKQILYSKFLSRLTANGYKIKSSKIEDGSIKKIFTNTTTTCIVKTSTSEGTFTKVTTYIFTFMDNLSYKLNSGDE